MGKGTIAIPVIVVLIFAVAFIFLLNFYSVNKDAAGQAKDLKQRVLDIEKDNVKLRSDLKIAQDTLDEYKKETTILLAEYVAKETFWDLIGAKKLRLICGLAKIQFGESIPNLKNLPC